MIKTSRFKNKTVILGIKTIAVLAIVLLFIFLNKPTETPVISGGDDNTSVEQTTTDNEPIVDNNDKEQNNPGTNQKGEKVNAYKYIIDTMTAPQYWSEDEFFPLYSASWDEEEARKTLINATGWELVDESTATFKRGFKGTLTINFSEHTAICKDELSGEYEFLDYENDIYYRDTLGLRTDITRINKLKGTEWYWQSIYGVIDNTFRYYDELFTEAGCPLLNMPAGTLTKYKNKNAYTVTLEDDGLIHAPWKQEGYSFDWANNNDIEWLSNYKDIEKVEVPECETVEIICEDINGNRTTKTYGRYSPLFLVLADKNSSDKYISKNGSVWFDSEIISDNVTESLAVYYLAPALKELYGYSGVYFTDVTKLSGPYDANMLDAKDKFDAGFTYPYQDETQGILSIYPIGNMYMGVCYSYYWITNVEYLSLIDEVKAAYEYHGKTYPYGDDYLANFMMMYNIEEQIYLGLR